MTEILGNTTLILILALIAAVVYLIIEITALKKMLKATPWFVSHEPFAKLIVLRYLIIKLELKIKV